MCEKISKIPCERVLVVQAGFTSHCYSDSFFISHTLSFHSLTPSDILLSLSYLLLQLVTGILLTTDLGTPAQLTKFQTAIVKSVANILNLYALGGSISTPVVTASSRRELQMGRSLLQSGVNVAYVGMSPFRYFYYFFFSSSSSYRLLLLTYPPFFSDSFHFIPYTRCQSLFLLLQQLQKPLRMAS